MVRLQNTAILKRRMNDRIYHTAGIIGSIAAWSGVFNLIATGLAICVSVCALIITGPKAWDQIKAWIEKSRDLLDR